MHRFRHMKLGGPSIAFSVPPNGPYYKFETLYTSGLFEKRPICVSLD